MSTRVLLVDDHKLFRHGLRLLLEQQYQLDVAADAANGAEALAHVQREAFDLILMDIHLPDMDGLEISRQILKLRPESRIIVVSSDVDPARIDEALLVGAMGYVFKANAPEELGRALAAVQAGNRYLSPEANTALLEGYQRVHESPPAAPELSPREREVVRLIAAGHRTKEIAATLDIGVKSAETYRRRVMQKLGLFSVAEITRYAIREGLAPQ